MTPPADTQDRTLATPPSNEIRTAPESGGDAGFSALGLDSRLLAALDRLGYEEPTPIQRAAIPPFLDGRDILAQAATGTGKTAAFALPLLQRLDTGARASGRAAGLVLVPTRELAMQVAEAIHRYGKELKAIALPVYGGASMETQIRALKRGVDIVVATPGRALDHVRRSTLSLDAVQIVVLDEADEMLDMGFAEDLEALLDATPKVRQTALFSATIPPRIAAIAGKHLSEPLTIRIDREPVSAGKTARIRQTAYIVPRGHKMAALGRVLDIEHPTSAIVFCRTRTEVDELTETINARGYRAEALHGGMSQDQRDRVMKRFRAGKTDLLIATDVAARGLDVQHVSHVVNYDVPSASDAYVHRIGRTGRAGREGVAITLAEPREHRMLRHIEQITKQTIEVAQVPTIADLRARKRELTRASIRETILAGELDSCRGIVESLAEEFDVMDVAAAVVKIIESRDASPSGEEEIPAFAGRGERGERGEWGDRRKRGERAASRGREERGDHEVGGDRGERADRGERRAGRADVERPRRGSDGAESARPLSRQGGESRGRFSEVGVERSYDKEPAPRREESTASPRAGAVREGAADGDTTRDPGAKRRKDADSSGGDGPPRRKTGKAAKTAGRLAPGARHRRSAQWDVVQLYIGAGRQAKVRPGDLVGAIANEAGIDSNAIGAIQIADRFSTVEVPEEIADDIIAALRQTTIKGRQVLVRRDRTR